MAGIIYTETRSDKDSRTWIDIGDGRNLCINITGEGVIMDVYGTNDILDTMSDDMADLHLGTAGMMFDEWADWVGGLMPRAYQMPDPTVA